MSLSTISDMVVVFNRPPATSCDQIVHLDDPNWPAGEIDLDCVAHDLVRKRILPQINFNAALVIEFMWTRSGRK